MMAAAKQSHVLDELQSMQSEELLHESYSIAPLDSSSQDYNYEECKSSGNNCSSEDDDGQ